MDSLVVSDGVPAPERQGIGMGAARAVLAQMTCIWDSGAADTSAVLLHAGRGMLVLEATTPAGPLPPLGTPVRLEAEAGAAPEQWAGRLADLGRAGRFLVSIGERPVRRAARLRVSLPGTLRSSSLPEILEVEIADLTTAGARIRGVELPVGTQVTLGFTPPGRTHTVTVRAYVAHGTRGAERPWIGVAFRLVALRGGR